MWLTALATIAKRTGYPVVEVNGWRTRGRAPMSGAKSVICHHTAGGPRGNYPSLGVVTNGRAGLPGPLANYGLGRDGTIYVIAAGRANHAGVVDTTAHSNSYAIGIEAENTGTGEKWSDKQMDAYAKLCREICDHYGIPISQVKGHKEVARPRGRKPDPNFDMNAFRTMVKKRKGTGGSPSSTTGAGGGKKYKVVSKTADLGLYDKDGNGHTRIKDWQTDALGYKGKDADGYFGPDTRDDTKALQKQIGLKGKDVDGMVGETTMAAWVKAGRPKLKKTAKPKPKAKAFPLPSGHWYGPESKDKRNHSGYWPEDRAAIKDIQRAVGASVDGRYGNETYRKVKAKQRKLGIRVDGGVGKQTWSKLF